jgi:hypothetical protein
MAAGVGGAEFNNPPQRPAALAPPGRGFFRPSDSPVPEEWSKGAEIAGEVCSKPHTTRLSEFRDRNWTSTRPTARMRGPETDSLSLAVACRHVRHRLVVSGWRHHERVARPGDRVRNTTRANSGLFLDLGSGGTISLAGNVLGEGIVCQIKRTIGRQRIERYLERPTLQKYLAVIEARGLSVVLLLRINPFTSSDLVSYAAGLTRIPIWKVMAGTLFGMFSPSLLLEGDLHGVSPLDLSRGFGRCRLPDLCSSHPQTARKVAAHIRRVLIFL